MRHPFITFWEQKYPLTPPRNWTMKLDLPDRWLRIHTLPHSKRYAESAAERSEIAARQEMAAAAVFDVGGPAWIVAWRYGEPPYRTDDTSALGAAIGSAFEEACVLAGDEETEAVVVLVARGVWSASDSAALRSAIAEDRDRAMWVHAVTGEVFAPYDGGVDMIFSSVERRDVHQRQFAAWLSSLPSGL